jgi:hypothetical protein
MRVRESLVLMALCAFNAAVLRADVLITQSVDIQIGGKKKTVERKILLKENRMRIEASSPEQHTATIIDLDSRTITQIDIARNQGTVYEISKLRKYVDGTATGEISEKLSPVKRSLTVGELHCGEHSFDVSLPAYQDTNARIIGEGSACLSKGSSADQEFNAFLARAFSEGVVVNYLGDNAIMVALAREQTQLYKLLSRGGGIPLTVDLSTRFEGGLIGKMWNMAASHSVVTTTAISSAPLPRSSIDAPSSVSTKKKDH